MWGSAPSPGSWHSSRPLSPSPVSGKEARRKPLLPGRRGADAERSPLALCACVRASVPLLVGPSDAAGGKPGMYPFQTKLNILRRESRGCLFCPPSHVKAEPPEPVCACFFTCQVEVIPAPLATQFMRRDKCRAPESSSAVRTNESAARLLGRPGNCS